MNSYLQGQDLWDVVGDTKVNPLKEIVALKNWNVKAGKVMFAIKTTVDEEMLEHTLVLLRCQRKHGIHAPYFSQREMIQDFNF